jgi:hypothetical protein
MSRLICWIPLIGSMSRGSPGIEHTWVERVKDHENSTLCFVLLADCLRAKDEGGNFLGVLWLGLTAFSAAENTCRLW